MEFTCISTERLMLYFRHRVDKHRIFEGGPWNFDNHLILLGEIGHGKDPLTMDLNFCNFSVWLHGLPCPQLSRAVGQLIGSKLGSVKYVTIGEGTSSVQSLMRVRVSQDLAMSTQSVISIKRTILLIRGLTCHMVLGSVLHQGGVLWLFLSASRVLVGLVPLFAAHIFFGASVLWTVRLLSQDVLHLSLALRRSIVPTNLAPRLRMFLQFLKRRISMIRVLPLSLSRGSLMCHWIFLHNPLHPPFRQKWVL
ncbi:hypothetical protein Salat_1425600 [Sesamum alatum]|uniref:DUF4283 domain-containing protein n=1 Tax=Sesamum alatum TaxID=300844 RepID=A0AAE1YAK6_9LAMI|nr:hypothetical protein Salat_1425600 [Sesamum alatum]